ncbi:MAG TPA: hypothetical protein VMX12_10825, partial [Acidimicrobiia bacterium]|nr:hypothetical protein [Acidimicrobiia bacterium]
VGNAWRTPVVNSEGLEWINMQMTNRDMEWANFIDWLLKVACSVYLIAPEEIGFQFGNGGQSSSMSEGSQEHKLQHSQDKGLLPLARFMAAELDRNVVEPLDDRFTLEFVGLNARTAEEQINLDKSEVETLKTLNEKRAERDLDPLPGGDIVLNQYYMQSIQAQQQGGDPGDGGPQLDANGLNPQGTAPGEDDPEGDRGQDENGDGYVNPAVSDTTGGEMRKSRVLDLTIL